MDIETLATRPQQESEPAINDALESIETYDTWSRDFYEPAAQRHYDAAIARMLKHLRPAADSVVLDAGCGTGVHSIRVARAGFRVLAIDISTAALQRATAFAAEAGLQDRIEFQAGDITRLPIEDATFEAIFSWGVLIHLRDVDAALRELVRVLKPGGRIALQVTNHKAWDYKIEDLGRWLLRRQTQQRQIDAWGEGWWGNSPHGRLWNYRMNVAHLKRQMQALNCRCVHHGVAEATELQRLAPQPLRTMLRMVNSWWFALGLPARPACTNLLVFERAGS